MLYVLLLFIVSLTWAFGFYFIRVGVKEMSVFVFSAYRLVVAFACFLVHSWVQCLGKGNRVELRKDITLITDNLWIFIGHYVVMGALNFVLPFVLTAFSQSCVTLSLSSIAETSIPFFTMIFAHCFTKDEKCTKRVLTGIILGFLGIGLAMYPTLNGNSSCSCSDTAVSIVALLVSSIGYGFCNVYYKLFLNEISPVLNGVCQLGIASWIGIIVSLATNTSQQVINELRKASLLTHLSAVMLGAFCIYLCYYLQYKIISHMGSVFAGMSGILMPVTAIIIGGLLEREWWNLSKWVIIQQVAGLAVALTGTAIIIARDSKKPEKVLVDLDK